MLSLRAILSFLSARSSRGAQRPRARLGLEQLGERINPVLTYFTCGGASGFFDYDDTQVDETQASQAISLSPFQFNSPAYPYSSGNATATLAYGELVDFTADATCTDPPENPGNAPPLRITYENGTYEAINLTNNVSVGGGTAELVVNAVTFSFSQATVNREYKLHFRIYSAPNTFVSFEPVISSGGTTENLRDTILVQLEASGIAAKATGTTGLIIYL